MNSLNLVLWCHNRIKMRLKTYSRDFLIKNNNKRLPSEPSFDNLTCIFPISFQAGMGKGNVEAQRNMPHIFLLQTV